MSDKMSEEQRKRRFWKDKDTLTSIEQIEHTYGNPNSRNPDLSVVETEKDYDVMAERERQIRKAGFITEWLKEKRDELGPEHVEKNREKFIKEAEKAYERKQAEIAAILKRDEEERAERLKADIEANKAREKWNEASMEFLEEKLFTSKSKREKALIRYSTKQDHLQRIFFYNFFRVVLDHLDKIEGRKLKE